VHSRWVRLQVRENTMIAESALELGAADWLAHYLQINVNLASVLDAFPGDPPMREAVSACRGLRLLRQDPWECLASFILSSTKQIVQIQQIVSVLCERFGEPVAVLPGLPPAYAFPTAERLARAHEAELRACRMGFRAPYLKAVAERVARGDLDLDKLATVEIEQARTELLGCPGVGRKIADCVLLFAYGFQQAFPVDVWVAKALRELYFPHKLVSLKELRRFSETHFGPRAGYAQQYLFHYMRTRGRAIP
jgi:N-glycosylase/DNA lyase